MFSYNMILRDLECRMKESRFRHTLGVVQTAEKLALRYNADRDKAAVAALLHDCSKTTDITEEQMYAIASRTLFKDEYPLQTKGEALLHALASEVIAREKYGVEDMEILSAIRWHTTGRIGMSALDMIVYSADMVEPSRKFDGVEKLRLLMNCGLERLTFECMKHCVSYLEQSGSEIHQTTLDSYNYLKEKLNETEINNG